MQPPSAETRSRAIDRLEEMLDRKLYEHLTRHEQVRWLPAPPALPQSWREVTTYLEPRKWYAGYLGVRGEVEIPAELLRDLRERVPQALLRDLYRPVRDDRPVEWQPFESDVDPGGRRALAEARAALSREPVPQIGSMLEVVMAEQARRWRLLREPWQPILPDDAPRQSREVRE